MQLITFLSTASAMVAVVSAKGAIALNKDFNKKEAYARIVNRCDYPVHLWSVYKGDGCPTDEMVTLKTGEVYNENYQDPLDGKTGVSIKISKTEQCKGQDIVQLEYFLEKKKAGFKFNYLDMSYVDCLDGDCPTKNEGYHLVSGSQSGASIASAGNTWCPILACHDAVSCAKISYIWPDDVQTKTCGLTENMDLYLCGGEAPTEDYEPVPASSAKSTPTPTPTSVKETYSDKNYKVDVAAAAITKSPEVKEAVKQQKTKTQVQVVTVVATEYVNAKRHAHGHARRHKPFQA